MLFCCFEVFLGKFTEKFSFYSKKWLSQRSTEILRKFVFLDKFEKEQIQRKIRICCKQPFLSKAVKLEKYKQKLFFSYKWATYSLNYGFLLFWSIFGAIHWKLCFSVVLKYFSGNLLKTSLFSKKSNYLRKEQWNTQKICFS